jgi:hypothetical protein
LEIAEQLAESDLGESEDEERDEDEDEDESLSDEREGESNKRPRPHGPVMAGRNSKKTSLRVRLERERVELESDLIRACVKERNSELSASIKENIRIMHQMVVAAPKPEAKKQTAKAAKAATNGGEAKKRASTKKPATQRGEDTESVQDGARQKDETTKPTVADLVVHAQGAAAEAVDTSDHSSDDGNKAIEDKIENIAVLPVSSRAFRNLHLKGRSPLLGFETEEHTGIPQLAEWITHATLEKREAHANAMLVQCSMLFDALDSITNSLQVKMKHKALTRVQKKRVDGLISRDCDDLAVVSGWAWQWKKKKKKQLADGTLRN